jgi:protein SCO1/2
VEQQIGFQMSTQEFLHTENFLLVDGGGHLRGLYKGTLETEMERLKQDIAVLLSE